MELVNARSLWEYWVESGATLLMTIRGDAGATDGSASPVAARSNAGLEPYGSSRPGSRIADVVRQAQLGFANGLVPKLAMDGEGGTYFVPGPRHRNQCVGGVRSLCPSGVCNHASAPFFILLQVGCGVQAS